ncbi:hypothetical protein GQ457_08G010260 [Hibiscus cannabinus]
MASPIKQESWSEEVKPSITSLNSTATLPVKTEPPSPNNYETVRVNLPMKIEGSQTNSSPNDYEIFRANRFNLPMKNEGSGAYPSPINNEDYRIGSVRQRDFVETAEEENKGNVDLNVQLLPQGVHLADRFSSNRCPEMSSTSISITSNMLLNNQDSSHEELELSDATVEEPCLVVVGCSYCLMYVMVSEVEPRCPKCRTSDLIDIFRSESAKRSRRV